MTPMVSQADVLNIMRERQPSTILGIPLSIYMADIEGVERGVLSDRQSKTMSIENNIKSGSFFNTDFRVRLERPWRKVHRFR